MRVVSTLPIPHIPPILPIPHPLSLYGGAPQGRAAQMHANPEWAGNLAFQFYIFPRRQVISDLPPNKLFSPFKRRTRPGRARRARVWLCVQPNARAPAASALCCFALC